MARRSAMRPLEDKEHDALSELLEDSGCMSYWELRGLLTAVVSAPTLIPPDTWQRVAFGENAFASPEDAREVIGLVFRLYNQIITELDEYSPVLYNDAPDDIVSEWCWGYVKGARLDPVWFSNENDAAFVIPAAILSGDLPLVGEKDADGKLIEDATPQRQKARAALDVNVLAAYRRFQERRRKPAPATAAPKVGRNEPCPCGSGRKHKKCCGQPA